MKKDALVRLSRAGRSATALNVQRGFFLHTLLDELGAERFTNS